MNTYVSINVFPNTKLRLMELKTFEYDGDDQTFENVISGLLKVYDFLQKHPEIIEVYAREQAK